MSGLELDPADIYSASHATSDAADSATGTLSANTGSGCQQGFTASTMNSYTRVTEHWEDSDTQLMKAIHSLSDGLLHAARAYEDTDDTNGDRITSTIAGIPRSDSRGLNLPPL